MTPRAKLLIPLGESFFEEVQARVLSEVRVICEEKTSETRAGDKSYAVPYAAVVLTAFDPKDNLVIESRADLGVAYFKDEVKEAADKTLAWVKEQADKRGLAVKDGRWVPA